MPSIFVGVWRLTHMQVFRELPAGLPRSRTSLVRTCIPQKKGWPHIANHPHTGTDEKKSNAIPALM